MWYNVLPMVLLLEVVLEELIDRVEETAGVTEAEDEEIVTSKESVGETFADADEFESVVGAVSFPLNVVEEAEEDPDVTKLVAWVDDSDGLLLEEIVLAVSLGIVEARLFVPEGA